MELSYVDFEARFRGASETVTEEQRAWLPLFLEAPGPVVDVGCGRGEFLALLREAGVPSWGVDSAPPMIEAARARGVDARLEGALDHLASLDEGSLGGVFMAHVIEHLPRPDVLRFLGLAARRLRPGGVLVVETLNPQCLFSHAPFAMDLSHEWPIHPQTLQFLLEGHGFERIETVYRQYLPADMLTLVSPDLAAAATPFERAAAAAVQKMQLLVDLAFKDFIYTMAARRPSGEA